MVGTPDEAIAKILSSARRFFHHDRYLMQKSVGDQPQAAILPLDRASGHGGRARVRANWRSERFWP